MASEKWLNFIEIKSHNLFSYLSAMKSKGYCIVGAEQTASGKYLHNTVLPHKMILVLGFVSLLATHKIALIYNTSLFIRSIFAATKRKAFQRR